MTSTTLSAALAAAHASGSFSARRLHDLNSDAHQVARILKQPLEEVSLQPRAVRAFLPQVARATGGKRAKRFQNLRANIKTLSQLLGLHEPAELESYALTGAWQRLYESIPVGFNRMGIVRALRFFAWSGLEPDSVNDAALDAFAAHLEGRTFVAEVRRLVWRSADSWNRLADEVPGWPQQRLLTRRDTSRDIARPLGDYPESFQRELDAYFVSQSGADPFAGDRPRKPLRPATIETRRGQLRRVAHDLVKSGLPIERITSLADLVILEAFQTVLRPRYDLVAQRWPMAARQIAALLVDVARWLHRQPEPRVSAEDLENLEQAFGTITTSFAGVPESTRALLRELDDAATMQRFLAIPGILSKQAREWSHAPVRAAQTSETALLVDLAQRIPLRRRNFAALDLDRHLVRDSKGRLNGLLLDETETKNGRAFTAPLPDTLAKRIDTHLKKYRPNLPGAASSRFLFPSKGGQHRCPEAISRRFISAVEEHTGLRMRLHDVRHVAAWMMFSADARNGPLVQQLLNHSNLKTTERYYGSFRQKAALEQYDQLLNSRLPRDSKSTKRK